jgi:hypothetical protein
MGGLLAKTAVANSGTRVWDAAFTVPPEKLDASDEDRRALEEVFMFQALPFVTRAVFIMTPHAGSNVALGLLGGLSDRLVRLPPDYTSLFARITAKNLDVITPSMRAVLASGGPTSVRALRPNHPVLLAFHDVPVDPRIPFHLVVGDLGRDGVHVGDGVVGYESQIIPDAASIIVVPVGHRQLERAEVNDAVTDILLQHALEHPRASPLRTLSRGSCAP